MINTNSRSSHKGKPMSYRPNLLSGYRPDFLFLETAGPFYFSCSKYRAAWAMQRCGVCILQRCAALFWRLVCGTGHAGGSHNFKQPDADNSEDQRQRVSKCGSTKSILHSSYQCDLGSRFVAQKVGGAKAGNGIGDILRSNVLGEGYSSDGSGVELLDSGNELHRHYHA